MAFLTFTAKVHKKSEERLHKIRDKSEGHASRRRGRLRARQLLALRYPPARSRATAPRPGEAVAYPHFGYRELWRQKGSGDSFG